MMLILLEQEHFPIVRRLWNHFKTLPSIFWRRRGGDGKNVLELLEKSLKWPGLIGKMTRIISFNPFLYMFLNLVLFIQKKWCVCVVMFSRVSHSPTFVSNLFRKYLIWSLMILGYPKHNFVSRIFFPKVPPRPPWVWKSGFSSCSDYPVDGTLNLCHETLITHEKESVWSNRSVPRKRPKRAQILVIFKSNRNAGILARFGRFLGTECSDQFNSFSWVISVSWHKFRVPSTG